MARAYAMIARISSGLSVRPQAGIMADFPNALPPSVVMFCRNSSLMPFNVAPSFIKAGVGVKFMRLEGPAGVESAWHQTQFW